MNGTRTADTRSRAVTTSLLVRLSKLANKKSAFVLLYELSLRREPVGLVELSRAFGVDPAKIHGILKKLSALGFVERRGQRYIATEPSKVGIRFLQTAVAG